MEGSSGSGSNPPEKGKEKQQEGASVSSESAKKRQAKFAAELIPRLMAPTYPSDFTSYYLAPSATIPELAKYIYTHHVRIAVLDFPRGYPDPPATAATIVRRNRETDWTFCTQAGQAQLLLDVPGRISRFIMVGNSPVGRECGPYNRPEEGDDLESLIKSPALYHYLVRFLPSISVEMGQLRINTFMYHDGPVRSVVLHRCFGQFAGEMIVEDTEIKKGPDTEFRRRLRFKRMPNLTQTEIRIVPQSTSGSSSLLDMKFQLDLSCLVQRYLSPMVAGLALGGAKFQACFESGDRRPSVLCAGLGGGALAGFLATQLDFDVSGIESDRMVVDMATQYFGLNETVRVVFDDAIEMFKRQRNTMVDIDASFKDQESGKVDVIMLDLDPPDVFNSCMPPPKFHDEQVIAGARYTLRHAGLLIFTVHCRSRLFQALVLKLKTVFAEVYKIGPGSGPRSVVIATTDAVDLSGGFPENAFMAKLKSLQGPARFLDKIDKI